VYVVIGGHPANRVMRLVTEFVAAIDSRLRLFVLPAYSRSSTLSSGPGRTSSTTESGAPTPTTPTSSNEGRRRVAATTETAPDCPASSLTPDLRYITA
jgi:hypothetical protein